eukprot:g214.t1
MDDYHEDGPGRIRGSSLNAAGTAPMEVDGDGTNSDSNAVEERIGRDVSMSDGSDEGESAEGSVSGSDDHGCSRDFPYSEKKAAKLGAVLSGFSCPFATSFTLKTSSATLPVVKLIGRGQPETFSSPNTSNLSNNEFCIRAPSVPAIKASPSLPDNASSTSYLFRRAAEKEEHEAQKNKRSSMLQEQKARLQALLSQMPQAAFGHGAETKRDTAVRDALQLPAEKFEVKVGRVDLGEYLKQCGALEKIQSGLQIDTELALELYSLNVYQEGGHFVKHKDTPRGDDMLGTLVVGLGGCYYEGGAMKISAGLQHKEVLAGATEPPAYYPFHSSTSKVQVPDPTNLHCAAFFSDIDHEIAKVTSGVRMTVAFLIKRTDKNSASELIPRELTQVQQEKKLADLLTDLLHNEKFLTNGGTVGFPCFHLYTNSEVFPSKDRGANEPLTRQQILQLKGKDAAIGRAVDIVQRKVGGDLRFFLTPYLSHEFQNSGDYLLSRFPVGTRVPGRMDEEKVSKHFQANPIGYDGYGDRDGEASGVVDVWALEEAHSHEAKFAGETQWSDTGYFGNEASSVAFYVQSFLRLVFPPYADRTRAGPVAAPTPARKNVPKGKGAAGGAAGNIFDQDGEEPGSVLQRDPEEVTEAGIGKISALWRKFSSANAGIKFDAEKVLNKPATATDLKILAALEREFRKQAADPLFLQKGGLLMFPCQATYSSANIIPRAKMMTATQKKAKDEEFKKGLLKAIRAQSSLQPPAPEPAAPAVAAPKKPAKTARDALDKKQIDKLKSAEKLVAAAAEKAGLSMKFRIYETDGLEEDDPWDDGVDGSIEHDILSMFPPELPKSMSRSEYHSRSSWYLPDVEDIYMGTFNEGKFKKNQHWIADFDEGGEERVITEFVKKQKKKMGNMKSKKNAGAFGGGFGDSSEDDSLFSSDEEGEFGGGGGLFSFGGMFGREAEPDFGCLIYRTALMVIVPAAENRAAASNANGSQNGGGSLKMKNVAAAAPSPKQGGGKSSATCSRKSAPKATSKSKAAAGVPKPKAAKAAAAPKAKAKAKAATKKEAKIVKKK